MSFFTEAAAIIFKSPFQQKIGKLSIDILDQRGISEKSDVTKNPIEGGFNSDNIKRQPTVISFTARISSFSLKNSVVSQITSLAKGKIPNRLKEAHDELYRIYEEQEPITLVMKYRTYESMVMSMLDIPSEAGDGEVLRFSVTFEEVHIAESQLISIDNSKIKTDNAKKQSNFGRQTGGSKTASPAVKPSSLTFGQFIKSLF